MKLVSLTVLAIVVMIQLFPSEATGARRGLLRSSVGTYAGGASLAEPDPDFGIGDLNILMAQILEKTAETEAELNRNMPESMLEEREDLMNEKLGKIKEAEAKVQENEKAGVISLHSSLAFKIKADLLKGKIQAVLNALKAIQQAQRLTAAINVV